MSVSVANVRRKVPIGYNGVPQIRPQKFEKYPFHVDRSPNPITCLIPGPVRPMMPNGIRIRSAVYPQCTGHTDARTHRPTDRPQESLITIGRCATRATRPKMQLRRRCVHTWPRFHHIIMNVFEPGAVVLGVSSYSVTDGPLLLLAEVHSVHCVAHSAVCVLHARGEYRVQSLRQLLLKCL